jgi:lipopolysaccharide transport system ATP-binding protein
MSDAIITVENLGKKYRISHQGERQRYVALRDVMAEKAGRLFKMLKTEKLKLGNKTGDSIPQNAGGSALRHSSGSSSEDFWALKEVNFEVKRGEVVGIIGRNGAGKSTLLKILSRITEPTTGRVTLRGRVASLLEVGTGFHPELTGRENVFLNGAILGMRRAEIKARFDEIVAFAEVEKFLDTPVKRYSSGMYVRLAFAVAAHLEPEILIVDEVLAVGDAQFQKKCLGKMQDVATKEGRTVLFVSHSMTTIRNLCGRGLWIAGGQKCFDGSAESAIAEYSASTTPSSTRSWNRPSHLPSHSMVFETINAEVTGQQPQLCLECDVVLQMIAKAEPVFIAVDICDQHQTPLMQALPATKPFISARNGRQRLLLKIDLPPLIPGQYALDFWIGEHFSSTVDYVKNVVSFEITDSPSAYRAHPHSPAHGFIVPGCRYEFLPLQTPAS